MFTDPFVVTINAIAHSLNRTSAVDDGAKYANNLRTVFATITHTYRKRARHTARFQMDSLVANPLVPGNNVSTSRTCYLTVDAPLGDDLVALKQFVDGALASLTASSGANITKLLAGES